jgi:hypothetical protein
LPIDSIFQIEEKKKIRKSYQKYTDDWKDAMNQAFEIARQHQQKADNQNKKYYDKKVRGVE